MGPPQVGKLSARVSEMRGTLGTERPPQGFLSPLSGPSAGGLLPTCTPAAPWDRSILGKGPDLAIHSCRGSGQGSSS